MMETVSAESVQKRTAKSARLLNRLMKKPGGNKAKEKTANADISDVAAIARSALALKKMAVTHNAKAKDHAKKMAEKERMLRIRLACEGSSMPNSGLAGFVTELRNAAVVIQRAWRKSQKAKYWLALERMLACEDEEAVLMEMNNWGGMSIANDNFQRTYDDNVMLVTMPEYYTGSEYDDLSCYSEYFSDDLEVDAQDVMDAAQELRDGHQEELEADGSDAESLYDVEVEKRARKKARKRRRLKKKEKVLAEFEDAKPVAPTDLENQAPSISIQRKRKKKPDVANPNSPRQTTSPTPKPQAVTPKQSIAPFPKSPRPPPKKPKDPVAKPSKPGRRQAKSLDLPRQQAVVAKRERQASVTEKPPIVPTEPAEPIVPSEPTPKTAPPRNMWLRGQQGEQHAKKPEKLPALPKHNTPNISDVKSRYMEPSPAKKTREQLLKATAAKIAKSTPLVPTVLEPFTVSEFKKWTISMKLRFALLRKSISELLEDDGILGDVKQRLRTWVDTSEKPAEGGAAMGDLEVWASRILTPTSNAAAAGKKNGGAVLTEQQMEAINEKVKAFQTSLASLDKLLVVGSKVETFANSFLDAPAVLPSSRQSVSLPPVAKPSADVASGTCLDSMYLPPKDLCDKLNKSIKDLNAEVRGGPPPGGRLIRERHASVDGTATSTTSYHERGRHMSMDGVSSHHDHEDFSQEVLASFRHNQCLPDLNLPAPKQKSRRQKESKYRSLRAEVLAQQAASRQNQDPRRGIDSLMPHSSVRDHLWGHSGMLATSLHAGEFDVERSSRSLDSIMPWHPLSAGDLQSIDGHHFPLPPGAPKPGLPSEGPVTPSQLSFSGSVVAAPAQEAKTGYRGRRFFSYS